MPTRDETHLLKFPETAGVIVAGNGLSQVMRNLSHKVFEIEAGDGNFSLALEYSITDGDTWNEFLAAQTAVTASAPTALPAVAEAYVLVRCVVSSFVAEGNTRPKIHVVGRRDTD